MRSKGQAVPALPKITPFVSQNKKQSPAANSRDDHLGSRDGDEEDSYEGEGEGDDEEEEDEEEEE